MNWLTYNDVYLAFWIFLPAGIANMAPPIANKIPILNRWTTPIDLKKTIGGKRILGDHKTWRGLVFGVGAAALTCFLEVAYLSGRTFTTHGILISFLAGGLIGFGALLGDAVESFFKRRIGITSGNSWFPFDQIDYIIGGLAFLLILIHLRLQTILMIFVIYFGLHLLLSYVGFLIGFKDKPI